MARLGVYMETGQYLNCADGNKCSKHMRFNLVNRLGHTVGKNATDSASIIDAMDLLHVGAVDGFTCDGV